MIDQPVGRRVVLDEAARDAIPEHILAAFREHDVKTLGCPSVEITNWADCEPLRYTAEMEVRPRITLPDLASIEVVVDEVQVVEGVRPPRHVRDGSDQICRDPPAGSSAAADLDRTSRQRSYRLT